jgi:hypothetical protein
VLVRRGDNVLTGLRPLNPENLLQPLSLSLVPALTQLTLTDLLSRSLLLQDLHQLHVQLVTALLNLPLSLTESVSRRTTLVPGKVCGTHLLRALLVSVRTRHLVDGTRKLLLYWLPLIHETAVPGSDLIRVRSFATLGRLFTLAQGLLGRRQLAGNGSFQLGNGGFRDSGLARHLDRDRSRSILFKRLRWRHGRGHLALPRAH